MKKMRLFLVVMSCMIGLSEANALTAFSTDVSTAYSVAVQKKPTKKKTTTTKKKTTTTKKSANSGNSQLAAAKRAWKAWQEGTIHKGMTLSQIKSVIGAPTHIERGMTGGICYVYGSQDCKVVIDYDDYLGACIVDMTWNRFDAW